MYAVAELYYEAGKVYRRCQSTTRRPRYLKTAKFVMLHVTDPHLHCVPSLHVLLLVHTYLTIPSLIDKYSAGNGRSYATQKKYIYNKAVEITESILFMKQHSVNCIPAALYFMTKKRPEYTVEQALAFIDDIFTRGDRTPATAEAIRRFFRSQYRWMLQKPIPENGDYKDFIVDFLKSFRHVTA
jgi:hypothetical protein